MRNKMWLVSLILLLFSPAIFATDKALILTVNGPINPAVQDYITRGITRAANEHDALIILSLDTAGGLDNSMHNINEAIITSPVPIITYVPGPTGRVNGEGVFILYASHLAAMADDTRVGAAAPIDVSKKILAPDEMKTVDDAAAYMRSLAQLRGRNADWALLSVREGVSISAKEAKRLKVIDEVANDLPQLLKKIDGHTAVVLGVSETVKTKNLLLQDMPPDWRFDLLSFLTNPNIAYILLLIAIYGLFLEIAYPGLIFPGTIGVISFLLVLYVLQLMPMNYVGLALALVGLAFIAIEIYLARFGVMAINGMIAVVLGSILLFDMHDPQYQLVWTLIFVMSTVTVIFFFMVLHLAIRSYKKSMIKNQHGLIGSKGSVLKVTRNRIFIRVLGKKWEARSSATLVKGQKIRVINSRGLILFVEPLEKHHR